MNKPKPQPHKPSVDGLRRPQRRSLRERHPISSSGQARSNPVAQQRYKASGQAQAQAPSAASANNQSRAESTRRKRRFSTRSHSAVGDEAQKKRRFKWWPPRFTKHGLKRAGMMLGVLVIGVGGFFGYKLWSAANAVIVDRGDSALGLNQEIRPEDLTEEGSARINILLIGIPGEANYDGRLLSDVNMVLSVDTASEEASILSIPRDLLVDVEGYGLNRINAAHSFGEMSEAGKGPELLEQTVEDVLDIDINYFARVDFQGFIDTVDVLGGVTVEVEETLYDRSIEESYGEGGTYYVPAGTHHFDGREALQYVRCRKGTCGSDFGRAARQQQTLEIIRNKVLSLGTFTNPRRVSSLLDQFSQHFRTDISISEGLQLYELTKSYDSSRNFVLNTDPDNYLGASSVVSGALAPTAGHLNFTEIQRFVRGDLFRDGFLKRENAPITVLNGTTVPGQATAVQDRLIGLGYNVVEADNAPDQNQQQTVVYVREGDPSQREFTHHLLGLRMGVEIKQGVPDQYKQFKGDFIVVIGADYDES